MLKPALIVIAPQGYQDRELEGVRDALELAGVETVIGSTEIGVCKGKFGGEEQADVALRNVNILAYDLLVFIGGPGAAQLVFDDHALNLAKEWAKTKKPLGAICIAPTILAAAGVLRGRRATVWDNNGENAAMLDREGVIYTDEDVTVDDHIVTANGPEAAEEFGRVLASMMPIE